MSHDTPAITGVLKRALLWDAIITGGIAVVAVVLGAIFSGGIGVVSALIGAVIALVFLGITAASIIFANRYAGGELFAGIFFAIVLGGWLLKFLVFILLAVVLKGQPWIDPLVLFLSLIAAVIGSLVVDVAVVIRSRIPIGASGS
ncbi:hypothetical protein [Gryllotalpicola ginsengisoli]|uniref:hypothetical protein n=1 Tax=Gryllotalpicola ginsengisoli TaxID=444608 RepID=UPI000427F996|nr:hypothetical protein [Gryllotalpicola ginsengisoli]